MTPESLVVRSFASKSGPVPIAPGSERQIGSLLVIDAKLSLEDVERVLRFQREKGVRFGDAAVALGLATPLDVQHALSKQFGYPIVVPGTSNLSVELVAAYDPFAQQVEGFRALRSQLLLRWLTPESQRKSVAVVSAQRGEGRSYIAANLAIVFSQLGRRTLLIDADLRHPRQHALFGVSNAHGLSTVLSERVEEAIQRVPGLADLSIMAAGPTPPNPQELLSRLAFSKELENAGGAFDVIIVDTPPLKHSADAQTIAVRAGGALLLARRHRSRVADVRALAETLRGASAQIAGVILNDH